MNKENIIMKYDICFGYYSVSKEILPFATTYRVELMKVGKWMVGITRLGGWTSQVHSFNLIEKYIFKTYCII